MKLEITGLTKRFGDHAALDSLDLHVPGGKVLVLVGPSGGGKSTLLRVLGGLETPDVGQVVIRDQPLPTSEAGLLAYRRRTGFLFQQFNLFPHLTAMRNLTLPLEEVYGMSPAQAKEKAESALDRFGLLDHAHKRPAQPTPDGQKVDHMAEREAEAEDRQEALLDEAIEETFPGSDPISPKHIT